MSGPATQELTFMLPPASQWLLLCLVVGMCTVVGWIVRGAVAIVLAVLTVASALYRAHRRGVARVRTYEAKLTRDLDAHRVAGPARGGVADADPTPACVH